MEKPLDGMRVAIIATGMFEEAELLKPKEALENAGATAEIIAPEGATIMAARHLDKAARYPVDHLLSEVAAEDYDAVLLPGGALNADALRIIPEAQQFVRSMDEDGKPLAVICHAPWLLISAGIAKGRTLTSFPTLADDITNAGARWVDEEVAKDENWVSSRQPDDIPAFNEAMVNLFAAHHAASETGVNQEARMAFLEQISERRDDA
jgi:protease I